MSVRRNDRRVIEAAAAAAGLPPHSFFVEVQDGVVIVNHPDSMKWSREVTEAIRAAVREVTGMHAMVVT